MFENEIKFVNDFTVNKIKDLGPLFTVEQFLSTEIHPAIKKYVESEINYLIHQDRKKLIENSLFDYSGAKISNYFNLIADEIKRTKKVSFEDIKNITLQAVSFNANFVVRPKWALAKLVFGNNKSVALNDLQLMFNYTYYYEYMVNVFLAYMSKKKIINVSLTEFELIMNKIDRELFTLHQSKLVDNALYAIADFYNIGGLNRSSVPIEAVEGFLKEKNLTELLFKLKRGFPNSAKKKNEIEDIRKILYSAFPLDSTLPGVKESETKIEDQEHFENPIEDVVNTDESVDEELIEPEEKETETVKSEKVDDIFEEEKSKNIENILSEEEGKIEDDDISATLNEFLSREENENEEILLQPTEEQVSDDENIEIEKKSEENSIEINEDEMILEEFTKDIENNQDEEIIILEEKEDEGSLDFYKDEIEISMEDEENKKEEKILDDLETDLMNEEAEVELEQMNDDEKEVELEEAGSIVLESTENKKERNLVEEKDSVTDKQNFEDMFSFLTRKEIDRIINNVFNSDSEDFANTIEKMSACNSVEEANDIINEIFKYMRIKPHSKDAKALSQAVEKYFSQSN